MIFAPVQYALGAGSGALVGFTLGLVGGGGSILAVPLMVYLVGVGNPHVAIGTSALAVAGNAAAGLLGHARCGTVRWGAGAVYAAAGVAGALVGATLGQRFDGQRLLFLFALVMVLVGLLMLRRKSEGVPEAGCTRRNAPRVAGYGLATGVVSGFFGIGGGFLIVPGLVSSTGMAALTAVGTSLVAVTAFGLTTAAAYAASGLVEWRLALVFVVGGTMGSTAGIRTARRLAGTAGRLTRTFAALIFMVAAYMLVRSLMAMA